jgi:hypothetical protein
MATLPLVQVAMNSAGVVGRRGFLRTLGASALGAAAWGALPFNDLMAANADDLRKRQMSCILLWMQGGPTQFETFDPKPDHANGAGTKAIETASPSIRIAEYWPKTAAMMSDIALVRSMTNREGNHQRATYQLHTGYQPTGTIKHPNFGCNVAAELADPRFDLPSFVSIGGPTIGAGFLGASYEPFLVQTPERMPANVTVPVATDRFRRRLGLMGALEHGDYARSGGVDRVRDQLTLYQKASSMVLSPRVKTFELDAEPSALRDAYGRTPFGQGCLLARRLVEAGVPFVEVRSGGWDMHRGMVDSLKTNSASVDPGFATLIADLKSRGMLEHTLVIWMGEFGRTPKMNGTGGRDHYPRCFNLAIAGGGIRGGQVIGESSADGSAVKDRPVTVSDLLATACEVLKIDAHKENMTPVGRPIKVVDGGSPVKELLS